MCAEPACRRRRGGQPRNPDRRYTPRLLLPLPKSIFHRISRSSSYSVASSSVPGARRPLHRRYAPRSFSIALTIGSGSRQPGRGLDRREWARRPRVARAARDLVEDIGRGFGISAALIDAPGRVDRPAVPVGTLAVIDALVNAGKLDVAPIVDKRESSALQTVPDPSRPSACKPPHAGRGKTPRPACTPWRYSCVERRRKAPAWRSIGGRMPQAGVDLPRAAS